VIRDAVPDVPVVPRPRPGAAGACAPAMGAPNGADRLCEDLDRLPTALGPPVRAGLGAGDPARGRRWVIPATVICVALTALACGAAAGDAHARLAAADQVVAGTRVLMWADDATVPGGDGIPLTTPPPLPVGLMVAGSPVTVLRLLLGTGDADVSLALRPGARRRAEVRLRPDCAALGRDGGDPAAFASARAVVRLTGRPGLRQVPLDVLGNPSAVMLSLLAPCAAGTFGSD